MVELCCLDEGRSLYSVVIWLPLREYVLFGVICVCLLLLPSFPLDYCIIYFLALVK